MAKLSKTSVEVNYRKAQTPAETCHNCEHMLKDGRCTKVIGFVDRQHVCNLWSHQ